MARLPIAGPWITEKEVAYVADAARNAWYEDAATYERRFEQAFAEYIGVRYAVALPSCTSGIHLALAALGVGPGDEVIVPEITWIASAAPISYVGATPVFADIDASTWCISAAAFEENITERTRAVITVDLYGNLPDAAEIRQIAHRRGVAVIEDAAEAIGAEFRGRRAGGLGDAGVFSFHGSKTVTTGEGGMLVTDRRDLLERVQVLRDHGRRPGDTRFLNEEVAFKYRMSSLQAALGLAQLERIEELVNKKREIFNSYSKRLAGNPWLRLNAPGPDAKGTYWMVTVVLDPVLGITKEIAARELLSSSIDTRPFFYPLSSLPAYTHLRPEPDMSKRNPVAYSLSPYGLNLPSALCLEEADVAYVCERVTALLVRG